MEAQVPVSVHPACETHDFWGGGVPTVLWFGPAFRLQLQPHWVLSLPAWDANSHHRLC